MKFDVQQIVSTSNSIKSECAHNYREIIWFDFIVGTHDNLLLEGTIADSHQQQAAKVLSKVY